MSGTNLITCVVEGRSFRAYTHHVGLVLIINILVLARATDMTDSDERLGQPSYYDTSDTYVSAGPSSPTSVSRPRGGATTRPRPYPQRNRRSSSEDVPGASRRTHGRRSRTGVNGVVGDAMDVDEQRSNEHQRQINIQSLLRAWQNERHAPDILPVCDDLLSRTLDLIRSKVRRDI